MRLLKIGVYYSAYLKQFYARHPDLAAQAYNLQHSALIRDRFGSSNFWTSALNKLGYETSDLIINAQPLQKMWAAEQGFNFDSRNWLFEITAAQVKAFAPDVLLVADYGTVTAHFLRHLKEICPSIRLVLGWCGAPFRDGSIFNECDIVLSCVPELVEHFRKLGHRSQHVNHAFEPRVLDQLDQRTPLNADIVFLGSIIKSEDFHTNRERLLARLVKETDIQIWSEAAQSASPAPDLERPAGLPARSGDGATTGASGFQWRRQISSLPLLGRVARRGSRFIFGGTKATIDPLPSIVVDNGIRHRARPPLFGLMMFQQLHDSKVVLNTHIDISPVNASNMRLFETTGVGGCLLTDWKANLSQLFEIDSEVVAYRDADECIEKANYLLEHEDVRRSVAAAGQRRTLRDHTFEDRAARVDGIISAALIHS